MILTLVEHERGKLNDMSLETLTPARKLATQSGVPLHAVLVGEDARPLADRLRKYGVSTVQLVLHERLTDYAPEAWAKSLAELMSSNKAVAVLAAGTERGNEVLAHLAARCGLPMAANCTDIQPGETYRVTRLRWGGSLLEEAELKASVKLLSIAPHAFPVEEVAPAADGSIEQVRPSLGEKDFRVRVAGRVEPTGGKVSLGDARVVVGGGRGVGSGEGFKELEDLANLLGGTVGCSRAVTSLGWRPHSDQVGQTGSRIAPDLYIACGISGAIQHMIGCKASKHILAINTDPDAPILARADYAVVGDLHKVVPALTAEIRKVKGL